jgi:hypothetical protein
LKEFRLRWGTLLRAARRATHLNRLFDIERGQLVWYQILCRRLVRERLYDAACFITSSAGSTSPIHQPDPDLSFDQFTAALVGRAAYIKALGDR